MRSEENVAVRGEISPRLVARQARVGIVPNAVQPAIPAHPPREVWVRWPKLRSMRRPDGCAAMSPAERMARDPVLNGEKLQAYIRELRMVPSVEKPGSAGSHGVAGAGTRRMLILFGLLGILAVGTAALIWVPG